MNISKDYRKILQLTIIALIIIAALIFTSFFLFDRWEKVLVIKRMEVCTSYAEEIARKFNDNDSIQEVLALMVYGDSISIKESNQADQQLTGYIEVFLSGVEGLEGGIFMKRLDDFFGYAYPSSPPPIPVYGPPPRSYNMIKDQALQTISSGNPLSDLHAFDPAVFPLATSPVLYNDQVIGAVWVRKHIERELPLSKLKRVINLLTILSLAGFLVTAMFSIFLQSGIKNIRKELNNTKTQPGFRLKRRGGWFGFIPASINEMLDIIENEYTQRQELERRLQQKEKLASLGKMIAGVAHEVKTPLSIIKMRVQMWQMELKNNPELAEQFNPESLEIIQKEIDRLSRLVKRLTVFSRPIDKNLTNISLDQLIEEVLSLLNLHPEKKKVLIKKKLLENPPDIKADPNSLKQVILNIITNSIESIEEEGEILIETKSDERGKDLELEIADTGPGIPEEILHSVFDPFFTTKDTGTGLGLSISHEIISAIGGSISFGKNEQYGTICKISLPIYTQ